MSACGRCPSSDLLSAFNLGNLPEVELCAVADHLESCLACERHLQHLETEVDGAILALRRHPEVGPGLAQGSSASRECAQTMDIRAGSAATAVDLTPSRPESARWPPLPGFEVQALLGEGGMGVVYKARHLRLNRLVALKMIRSGERERLSRFRAEAETSARLQHPNIVQIFEVGQWDGQPYLVLELVEGGALADHLAGKPHPPCWSAALVAALARAIHYAHQRGVVHRDLKPGNVLLGQASGGRESPGDEGTAGSRPPLADIVPKIADFGLARRLDVQAGQTAAGDLLGTPEYMAPEQATGDINRVGPTTDVHALGAILYECLIGRPPFQGTNVLETLDQVRTQEPTPPRVLQPRTPRDLETVCLKCLRKEPDKRYATAGALAEDLTRFLEGKPVNARPVGSGEILWRWARRNPGVAFLLVCVGVLLVGGSLVSTWFALDARHQATQARFQEGLATDARNQAVEEKNTANVRAAELTFRLGLQQAEAGAIDRGLFLMLRAWRQCPAEAVSFRRVIRANLAGWSRQLPRLRQVLQAEKSPAGSGQIASGDPEGRTFLVGYSGIKGIRCFDSSTGRPVALPPYLADKSLRAVSMGGRWLSVGGHAKGHAVFDRLTGTAVSGLATSAERARFAELPDLVATWEPDGSGDLWDLLPSAQRLPRHLRLAHGDDCRFARTADGRAVALTFHALRTPAAATAVRVEAIDLVTGKALSPPRSLAGGPTPIVSRDGRQVVAESHGAWWAWDLTTGQPREVLWCSRRRPAHHQVTQDGLEVLQGEIDHSLRAYDLATGYQRGGDLLREPQRGSWGGGGSVQQDVNLGLLHSGAATSSPDGRLVFTLDGAGVARVWGTSLCQLQRTPATVPRRGPAEAALREPSQSQTNWSADGRRVILLRRAEKYALLLDARTGDLLAGPLQTPNVEHTAWSPDRRYLATSSFAGSSGNDHVPPMVTLRDGEHGQPIGKPWPSPKLIHALAFSPDGKLLAVGGVAGTVILDVTADTARALEVRHRLPEATCVRSLQWHADSRRLLVIARGGWPGVGAGLRVWDAQGGKPLGPFRPADLGYLGPEASWLASQGKEGGRTQDGPGTHRGLVHPSSFVFPPSEELVSCESGSRGLVRLSPDGKEVRGKSETGPLRLASFCPDGSRMAASTSISDVRQWDTRTGKPFGPALRHSEPTQMIRYSPDGKLLAVLCLDNSIRLWDADTGWPLGPPLQHVDVPVGLVFNDASRTLVSLTESGVLRAWPVPQPVQDDPDRFETWLAARGGLHLKGEEPVQASVEEWQAACRELGERWPQADSALPEVSDDPAPWHRRRALDAEEVGNERGELHHLTRLAASCPREPGVYERIARVHARVAARLPAGPSRDREWQLAWAAAERGLGRPGEDSWTRKGLLEALTRRSDDEALWYLDRLAARRGDWVVFAARASLHARRGHQHLRDADLKGPLALGGIRRGDFASKVADEWARRDRWADATRFLNALHLADPADRGLLYRLALAQVRAGNRVAHAELCKAVLRNLSARSESSYLLGVIGLCALSPTGAKDWRGLLELLEPILRQMETAKKRASDEEKKLLPGLRREWLTVRAALLHRAGQHGDAIRHLDEAMKLAPSGEGGPVEWAWLALVHAAKEKAPGKEARRWLDRARAALPERDGPGLWQAVQIEVLLAEAEKSLRGSAD